MGVSGTYLMIPLGLQKRFGEKNPLRFNFEEAGLEDKLIAVHAQLWKELTDMWKTDYDYRVSLQTKDLLPEHRIFGDLCTTALINWTPAPKLHRDGRYDICLMAVFGTFTGGELRFPEIRVTIPVNMGSVIFFETSLLRYQLVCTEGTIRSVMLVAHSSLRRYCYAHRNESRELLTPAPIDSQPDT
eukprot:TRINITY_DN26569_c0_g1_i1.p1 TRINITY_DN26569_c0_g1~~TRINITY_DN26569_c0_g1_i1.p1  ORF type:complete len:186 (-),score=13.62 TRINITY_DN26569_c0_g1_i1:25-582(-)